MPGKLFFATVLATGAAGLTVAAAQTGAPQIQPGQIQPGQIQPGMWRSTSTITDISIPGLPANVLEMVRGRFGQGYTSEQCISADDLNPDSALFAGENQENCEYRDFSYSGGAMRVELVCDTQGAGQAVIEVSGTGGPASYSGTTNMTITGGPMGTMRMSGTARGERIGDC